jgi:hypothetical protein
MNRTLYRDPDVRVTSQLIEVDGRRYALAELARVWHRRGERSWRALAGRGALGLAMLVPVGLGLIGVAVGLSIDASPTVTVAMVLGAVLVGFLAGPLADVLLEHLDRSYARGSREVEIWALWRGREVLLLRTGDQLRFGKIYRALQRALEAPAPVRSAR